MSNIYLIRHGFTPANNARYNNQRNLYTIAKDKDMPLDKIYGIKQAEELADYLSNVRGKTLILVSPYNRTKETLSYVIPKLNCEYEIKVCEKLHEIYSDKHYARTKDEVLELLDGAEEFYKNFEIDRFNTRYINGESEKDVRERVKDISLKILDESKKDNYENIIIMAHGTVNKNVYYWLTGDEVKNVQQNCEVIFVNEKRSVFIPKTYVPKGYIVNIEDYK